MRRHFYIVSVVALCLMGSSCGNGGSTSLAPAGDGLTNTLDTTPTTTPEIVEEEDDGDPTIKAASVDRMNMVVDENGNVVGRYVRTNEDTYTIAVQDETEVPIAGHEVVTFSAKNGQGVVYTHRTYVNVRVEPDLNSVVLKQISYSGKGVPETYPCLGKTKGWYKISIRGKVGYVRHDLVEWDGMDTF